MGMSIGVDSHNRSLAAAAVDELGRALGGREFPNDPAGHARLLSWVRTLETGHPFLMSFSAGLAMFDPEQPSTLDELMAIADERMYEVKRARAGARSHDAAPAEHERVLSPSPGPNGGQPQSAVIGRSKR
jgi:GGDEF domain-containing protein